MRAIEAVSLRDKPIAEVCETSASIPDIEKTLTALLTDFREGSIDAPSDVQGFIFPLTSERSTYGFFREPWALRAYSVMRGSWKITYQDREWMQGLLFGYTPRAIQRFIDAATAQGWFTDESHASTSMTPRVHVVSTEETAHLYSVQSHTHSIRSSRRSLTAHTPDQSVA